MGFDDWDEESEDSIPPCYGDEGYYNPNDRSCTDCPYVKGCGLKVSRLGNRGRGSTRAFATSAKYKQNRASTKTTTKTAEITKKVEIIVDEDDETTFTGALMHNASIEAMQAMVDELSNSIRHIPRKSYKNTWKRKKQ